MSSPERRTLAARLRSRRHYLRELEGRSVAEVEDMIEAIRLWSAHNRTWTEGADADARARAVRAVEERRDEIQEHLDEIDSKVADLQADADRLLHEDRFSNRDRC